MKTLLTSIKDWIKVPHHQYWVGMSIATVFAWFIVLSVIKEDNKEKQLLKMYTLTVDTLTRTRNSLNQEVAKASVYQAEKAKTFLSMKSTDAEVTRLQALVKQGESKGRRVDAALVISTATNLSLQDSLQNAISYEVPEAEHPRDTVTMWPIYTHTIKDSLKWIQGVVKLGRASFRADLEIRNDYDIVIGSERAGLFKRKQYAEIVNKNPYSSTKSMKVFQKTTVPNKVIKSSLITGIAVFLGTFLLLK